MLIQTLENVQFGVLATEMPDGSTVRVLRIIDAADVVVPAQEVQVSSGPLKAVIPEQQIRAAPHLIVQVPLSDEAAEQLASLLSGHKRSQIEVAQSIPVLIPSKGARQSAPAAA